MKMYLLLAGITLASCSSPPPKSSTLDQNNVRGINNPCIDNPNSGSSLCVDQNQNLAAIPPVEIAPPAPSAPTTEIEPG